MDWDTFHRTRYTTSIGRLTFDPRPARSFTVQSGGTVPPSFLPQDLPDEASMQLWLSQQRQKSLQCWPNWSLTVLALHRGTPTEWELRQEDAGDQLSDVGCSRCQFDEIMNLFSISRAFPESFDKDSPLVYSKQSTLRDRTPAHRHLDIIMRSNPSNLQDMAFGLRHSPSTSETFVVIHGCTEKTFKELESWLSAMKEYARHPLLMVNLFFELHQRRLHERYRCLRVKTTNLSFEVFGINESEIPNTIIQQQKDLVNNVTSLADQVGVVGNELIDLRLRLADIKSLFDDVATESDQNRFQCLTADGNLLSDNLMRLDQRIQSLQADNANMRASTKLLLPSIFNVIAIKDSQINKGMASAARRDSSVMVGITVGTLTFFPCTTIATIFALPIFDWNAAPGESVTDDRFWIYLAVTIPITTITLLVLAVWLSVADKASKEFLPVREYVRRLTVKSLLRKGSRRHSADVFSVDCIEAAEKAFATGSQVEP